MFLMHDVKSTKSNLNIIIYEFILLGCSGCTGAIVSASVLAVALSICVAVFTTVIIYIVRDKIEIKGRITLRSWRCHTANATARRPDYEDVKRDNTEQPRSAIDTRKNIAYGEGFTVLNTTSH